MMKINLNTKLSAEPILELETKCGLIDLHNDYIFVNYFVQIDNLKLVFKKAAVTMEYIPKSVANKITIDFEKFILLKNYNIKLIDNNVGLSLDNLSKSTLKNGNYFYILSFTDGDEYEIECKEANLILD